MINYLHIKFSLSKQNIQSELFPCGSKQLLNFKILKLLKKTNMILRGF